MPRGGRPLVIVKAIPDSMIFRTTARARGVRTLSGVTSAPSTSATTRRTSSIAASLLAIEFTSQEHNRALDELRTHQLANQQCTTCSRPPPKVPLLHQRSHASLA